MTQQDKELRRVRSRLAEPIAFFLSDHMDYRDDNSFFMEDLYEWTRRFVPCAPASVDRVLRALRQSGEIDYVVVDRAKSLYRVTRVGR